jgi:two-component system sensor histidine kinase ChiS
MSSGSCDKGFQALALDVLRRVRVGAVFVTARDADERVPVGTVLSVGVQAAATLLRGEGGIDEDDAAAFPLHLVLVLETRLAGRDIQDGAVKPRLLGDVDFSQLRHETVKLHCAPTDLHALTDLVLTVSQALIGNRPLRLFNRIDPTGPLAEVDENRMQQVLFNLVGNAIKFTPAGVVEVSARSEGNWLDVTVSDTGIGIAGERLDDIFQMFSQGDGSAEREQGGAGIGLAITKQLVELHGGTVSVDSEMGSGSRFTIRLPLSGTTRAMLSPPGEADQLISRVVEDVLLADSAQPVALGTSGTGYRILVVDDEPINVQTLVNYLTLAKYQVTTAATGEEALERLFSGDRYDLVLLDVMMPKISGLETCRRIRERFSQAELPVVLLTAKNRVSDLVNGFNSGANDYLTKPFASDELLARVKVHLELAKISDSYARFVPRQFLEQLGKERITEVALGDQVQRVMTVLFADIRDFTRLSEKMSPAQTFGFVNQYLGAIGPAITRHRGVIDKFVGDAVMALFPERAEDAIDAALEMFQQLEIFNRARVEQGEQPIEIGIGIHTGVLMLGTIGAVDRMDTTVISDAVNLASRVENPTKTYQVPLLITEATYRELREPSVISLRRIDRVLVQGKTQPVVLFEVIDADTPERRAAKLRGVADLEVGLSCYEASDFKGAVDAFEKVLDELATDSVTQVLIARAAPRNRSSPFPRTCRSVARLDKV